MLSRELEETLRRAMSNAATRSHEFATLEHLLLALTEDSDALEVLHACNVDIEKLAAKLGEFIEITWHQSSIRMAMSMSSQRPVFSGLSSGRSSTRNHRGATLPPVRMCLCRFSPSVKATLSGSLNP
jgi:ATP-dependent Clp protease ATP-binding subunit ClpA